MSEPKISETNHVNNLTSPYTNKYQNQGGTMSYLPSKQRRHESLASGRPDSDTARIASSSKSLANLAPSKAQIQANTKFILSTTPRCLNLNLTKHKNKTSRSQDKQRPEQIPDPRTQSQARITRLSAQLSSLDSLFPNSEDTIRSHPCEREHANVGRKRDRRDYDDDAGDVAGVGSWSGFGLPRRGAKVDERVAYGYKGYWIEEEIGVGMGIERMFVCAAAGV